MQEMFTSSKRPFFQSTQIISIGAIDKDKYSQFAINFFNQNNAKFPKDLFDKIYEKFNGYTWYMQVLLNRLYSYNRDVDEALVNYAIEQVVSEYGYLYSDMMQTYSVGNVKLLKAIANERCVKSVMSGEFIGKYELRAASSVATSLKKLSENEMIYLTEAGYIVYDRFMAEWLRNQPF